jgi:hypothetical protein
LGEGRSLQLRAEQSALSFGASVLVSPYVPQVARVCHRRIPSGWLRLAQPERIPTEKELITPPRFLLEWGRKGTNAGEFTSPIGISIAPHDMATDSKGKLYIADSSNQRIQKFAP